MDVVVGAGFALVVVGGTGLRLVVGAGGVVVVGATAAAVVVALAVEIEVAVVVDDADVGIGSACPALPGACCEDAVIGSVVVVTVSTTVRLPSSLPGAATPSPMTAADSGAATLAQSGQPL